jgi:metal-sulfur cluster biosynthetic enzyme
MLCHPDIPPPCHPPAQAANLADQVLQQLRRIIDPDFGEDIVSCGFVKELDIDPQGGRVSFTLELTTPACPVKDQFKREAQQYVQVGGGGVEGPGVVQSTIRAGVCGGEGRELVLHRTKLRIYTFTHPAYPFPTPPQRCPTLTHHPSPPMLPAASRSCPG